MAHPASRRATTTPRIGPVLEFMRRLWAVNHALDSASKRMARRLGVTGPQRLVIRMIGRFPGISAGALAEILHSHPSTLTGVLLRLQRRGLVVRRSDRADGRRALLELGTRGRALDRLRGGTAEAVVRRVLRRADRREVAATARLLETVAGELESSLASLPARRPSGSARPRRPARRG